MNYQERLLRAIPGGAHTYSRGYDQYPTNAPEILERGKGVYIYDTRGNDFLDYGMGLRAVILGYAESEIDEAAIKQLRNGTNLTRPSLIELEAAELLIDLIPSVEMVKFTKNGSTAVSAAVKLARAFTGRDLVARCAEQPFFSYDDWFISSTPITKGIPQESMGKTKTFRYNDISSLESLIEEYPGELACVILEPAAVECPSIEMESTGCCSLGKCPRNYDNSASNYLQQVQALCKKHGIVFVLDEIITGFRWGLHGAQKMYGVSPDLCTFGKAMANGYALACVAGRREIMELGSIEFEGQERVFLLSTTHGAEMGSLGAFVANVKFMKENNVIDHLWQYGGELITLMNRKSNEHGVSSSFKAGGIACSPHFATLDSSGINSLELRTLFCQEMIKNGVLMPWIALAYRHTEVELLLTEKALDASLEIYSRAITEGVDKYLVGPAIKPVFRKYN
jgi:glutamate-1-semialdehyde 2,1-aminomutase